MSDIALHYLGLLDLPTVTGSGHRQSLGSTSGAGCSLGVRSGPPLGVNARVGTTFNHAGSHHAVGCDGLLHRADKQVTCGVATCRYTVGWEPQGRESATTGPRTHLYSPSKTKKTHALLNMNRARHWKNYRDC